MEGTWQGEAVPRLILGTVQLGMDYGIANAQGKPDPQRAAAVVETAWRHGIRHFDTAQAYGDSESVLGRALRDFGIAREARIASKLAARMDPRNLPEIEASIEATFDRLGLETLWCMLLHDPAWLAHWDDGLGDLLRRYREAGRIAHLGVSLIRPSDAPAALAHPDVEVIQAPSNAWDRRLPRAGFFREARGLGKLCCVRSIYLQGLLTLSPEAVAGRLPVAADASRRWHALAAQFAIPPNELAVRYALTLDAPLVVGAESPEQVADTAALAERGPLPEPVLAALADALDPVLSEEIVEPFRWNRG